MPRSPLQKPKHFAGDYKMKAFQLWYNSGKPSPASLLQIMEIDEYSHGKPTIFTVTAWVKEFKPLAEELDAQVIQQMNEKLITAKVEMLERHASIGLEMQDKALTYLRSVDLNKLDDPALAVKIWTEGTKLERDSRGIPEMIQKMMKMSDDDLMKEIGTLISKSPVQLEANTDGED